MELYELFLSTKEDITTKAAVERHLTENTCKGMLVQVVERRDIAETYLKNFQITFERITGGIKEE